MKTSTTYIYAIEVRITKHSRTRPNGKVETFSDCTEEFRVATNDYPFEGDIVNEAVERYRQFRIDLAMEGGNSTEVKMEMKWTSVIHKIQADIFV